MPEGGAEGMILTSGGRFAGYGFYLLEGKPVFLWNLVDLERIKWEGKDALSPGKHTVEFDFVYDGTRRRHARLQQHERRRPVRAPARSRSTATVVDTKKMDKTIPIILQWDESFDIGSDTLTGVNDARLQAAVRPDRDARKADASRWTGPQLSEADKAKLQAAMSEEGERLTRRAVMRSTIRARFMLSGRR